MRLVILKRATEHDADPAPGFDAASHLSLDDARRRLELMMAVCDAVQHAHQKGVIHRDLNPANILVNEAGQPKVLDFGVARAIDPDLQMTTLRTNVGQLIGTLPYMSPEQVAGDSEDLDTRSDVYALGVILYELLAGRPPFAEYGPVAIRSIVALGEYLLICRGFCGDKYQQ
ncbi:MAG: protein kinase [Proteobacteria bacterium]|nr:protein kinase [Pseudomonadota bacterium]